MLRRNIALIVAVAASVLLVTTLLMPSAPAVQWSPAAQASNGQAPGAASALPVVLHVILDEHSGIEGLPKDVPGSDEFARWLKDFYVQRGFRIYTGAYSEYADTHEAIPNLLNFASSAKDRPWLLRGQSRPYRLTDSAYFVHLSTLGYRLHVYQSDYMDYCRVPGVSYASCNSYSAHDINALHATSIAPIERAQFIFNMQLERSQYIVWARQYYERARASFPRWPLPAWDLPTSRVGPIPVLPVFDRLAQDLRASSDGEAYFAHLMIPHYPYALDAACRVRPEIEDWLYALPIFPEEGNNWQRERLVRHLDSSRALRYRQYFEQIRCQQLLLDRLLEALTQADLKAEPVVIVHGDHGSRIVRRPILNWDDAKLPPGDFGDAYSTLFAVRCDGYKPGATRGHHPLQQLLGEVSGHPFTAASHKVYLRQDNGAKKIAALPDAQASPAGTGPSAGSCLPRRARPMTTAARPPQD
jgi:hypothetical protein